MFFLFSPFGIAFIRVNTLIRVFIRPVLDGIQNCHIRSETQIELQMVHPRAGGVRGAVIPAKFIFKVRTGIPLEQNPFKMIVGLQ